MSTRPGQVLNRSELMDDVTALTDMFSSKGYALATVRPVFDIDDETRMVAIRFMITEGDIYRVGRIEIHGNHKTREYVIRREVRLNEGDTYDSSKLKKSFRAIQNLNFFDTDGLLTDDERAVRDAVRGWVDKRLLPLIEACYAERRFPREVLPELAELGVFGANMPEKYGTAGLNNVAYGLLMQELERGDSGVRSFASVQSSLVMYPILRFGDDRQREHWLPKLASV